MAEDDIHDAVLIWQLNNPSKAKEDVFVHNRLAWGDNTEQMVNTLKVNKLNHS